MESTGPAKRLAVWEREKEFMKPTGWVGKAFTEMQTQEKSRSGGRNGDDGTPFGHSQV